MKIWELKRFVEKLKDGGSKKEKRMYQEVLQKMCDLFDIPRIEEFLGYEEIPEEPQEAESKKIEEQTLEERKATARKMLGLE